MRALLFALTLIPVLSACGPRDLPREEIAEVLFPSKGLLGGFELGDSWEDIKAKHPEQFEVRDDDYKQLRRDVGENAGSNGYFLGFQLDGAGKVVGLSAHISGKEQNAVTVRVLLDDVIAHFDKTIGKGRCTRTGTKDNSSNCHWEAPGKPKVDVSYLEMLDIKQGALTVSFKPLT